MIVTLLTDYGRADHYVAALKGVILSRDPRIVVVDISHEVASHDVQGAAFLLEACYREFPPGTVHLAVVDPGVGSPRRPVAIRFREYFFVGPDNGLFGNVCRPDSDREVREIDASSVGARRTSRTFHGRDIFAPTAAALATGVPIEYIGPAISELIEIDTATNRHLGGGIVEGRIVHIDRFGNCVMSLAAGDFPDGDCSRYRFRVGDVAITHSRAYYAEKGGDEPFIVMGSTGFLEISFDRRSAAHGLNLKVGDPVFAEPQKGKMARDFLAGS